MLTLAERRAEHARRAAAPEVPTVAPTVARTVAAAPTVAPVAPARSLAEQYRPRCLAELVGQPEAVARLRAFVARPYPTAFLFAGGTGTGKTSAAYAIAGELGCDVDQEEWGGVSKIESGDNTVQTLAEVWPGLFLRPPASKRGWRVLIVNEVERLNGRVELL